MEMYSKEWWERMDAMCYRMQEHLDGMTAACEARTASTVPENPSHDDCKVDFINGWLGMMEEHDNIAEEDQGRMKEDMYHILPEL